MKPQATFLAHEVFYNLLIIKIIYWALYIHIENYIPTDRTKSPDFRLRDY